MAEHLTPRERLLIQKFADNPIDFFTGETRGWLEDFLKTSSPTGAGGGGSGSSSTGDYKMSAQTATHTDGTGTWYLCDGSAIPAEEAELIVLVGANLPDARGRTLVMLGTHADVNLIGDNDGIGTVADRRPKHNTTLTDPGHTHPLDGNAGGGAEYRSINEGGRIHLEDNALYVQIRTATTGITAAAAGSSGGADQPAFIVPGNLFIHS